jgi:two-component system, NtrC family, sensor kinase
MTTPRSERSKSKGRKRQTAAAGQGSSAALRKQLKQRAQQLAEAQTLLAEALQQQTATGDVLKVISRSTFDLQAVLDALTESAARLCKADMATITRKGEGGHFYHVTNYNFPPDWVEYARKHPFKSGRGTVLGRSLIEKRAIQVADVRADPDYTRGEQQKRAGFRTVLAVPLQREGEPIGVFVLCRKTVSPFLEKQIELMSGFADQAVIAIENVRLFDEVKAKTRDLAESLQQQTATSDVLKVISRSAFDLQNILDTLVESAALLCTAERTVLIHQKGETYVRAALHGFPSEAVAEMKNVAVDLNSATIASRALRQCAVVHVADVNADPDYPKKTPAQVLGGVRTVLSVPLVREGRPIGAITLSRTRVDPFTPKQIDLIRTFADQAVIAIENVRLFDEVQAKTRDLSEALRYQTGSSNILSVIASSPTDVGPVLKAIVESACELCEAYDAVVLLKDGDNLRFSAHHGPIGINIEKWPISRNWTSGRAFLDRQPVHLRDVLSDEGAEFPDSKELSQTPGVRSILAIPLLRENESIGTILLRRTEVHPFSDKQIALLQTFADQAVIAIGNVRQFDEVQARTKELAASLDELRTAQDRLVQTEKLASLGQLTAGIAHEIKNPLNFVNNFSALSAELTDELNDVLKPVAMDGKVRGEVDELTGLLKDNLEKVVQHGKRADSIVKNMLLHSREGSGEHRPADINSILDESLNLAYHGARAKKGEFNITLQRDFDADAGTIELFPQEITRAFLNLIANGVYAATRCKTEDKEPGFEPTLRATTKNLGTAVEIRIRDNGTGIPAEVQEKMFNPFFTTKPAGEGTGLGLSMTHDIIVKQHGGRINVATEPGQFTEFTIVLPRKSNLSGRDRGKT